MKREPDPFRGTGLPVSIRCGESDDSCFWPECQCNLECDRLPSAARPKFDAVSWFLLASIVGVALACLGLGFTWGASP